MGHRRGAFNLDFTIEVCHYNQITVTSTQVASDSWKRPLNSPLRLWGISESSFDGRGDLDAREILMLDGRFSGYGVLRSLLPAIGTAEEPPEDCDSGNL